MGRLVQLKREVIHILNEQVDRFLRVILFQSFVKKAVISSSGNDNYGFDSILLFHYLIHITHDYLLHILEEI